MPIRSNVLGNMAGGFLEGRLATEEKYQQLQRDKEKQAMQMFKDLVIDGGWRVVDPKKGSSTGSVVILPSLGLTVEPPMYDKSRLQYEEIQERLKSSKLQTERARIAKETAELSYAADLAGLQQKEKLYELQRDLAAGKIDAQKAEAELLKIRKDIERARLANTQAKGSQDEKTYLRQMSADRAKRLEGVYDRQQKIASNFGTTIDRMNDPLQKFASKEDRSSWLQTAQNLRSQGMAREKYNELNIYKDDVRERLPEHPGYVDNEMLMKSGVPDGVLAWNITTQIHERMSDDEIRTLFYGTLLEAKENNRDAKRLGLLITKYSALAHEPGFASVLQIKLQQLLNQYEINSRAVKSPPQF